MYGFQYETTSSMLESLRKNLTKWISQGEINENLDIKVYFRERRKQCMFN